MGYWKSKVLPKIKKVFDLRSTGRKSAAAAEACKTFDDSKESISKEIEEKRTELQPKVVETYEATSAELKALVKDPKEDELKKHAEETHKFLEELVKIEFPGSKTVCEASTTHGVSSISGPIFFVFEKVTTFLAVEEKARALPEEVKVEEATGEKGKEIVEEKKSESKTEEKKEEVKSEQKAEEKKEEEAKSEGKKPEEKVEEKKSEEQKSEVKLEEKKVEEQKSEVKVEEKKSEDKEIDETKKEVKVEEKKEVATAAPTAKVEEKPAEPTKT